MALTSSNEEVIITEEIKQIAAILELIERQNYFDVSSSCKETELKYYLWDRHREMHGGKIEKLRKLQKWDKETKDICKISNVVDFVYHSSKSVVTVVNKKHNIHKQRNNIIGGLNYIIRKENSFTQEPFGLYKSGDSYCILILELDVRSPKKCQESAIKLITWYIELLKTHSPCYIHSNGFDIDSHEIDLFISYVQTSI